MLPIRDEFLLTFATYIDRDPSLVVRDRVDLFIANRDWHGPPAKYYDAYDPCDEFGDNSPVTPDDDVIMIPRWDICITLSLDHARHELGDWNKDVAAICALAEELAAECDREFSVELRFAFQPRYSEAIGDVSSAATDTKTFNRMIWTIINQRRNNPVNW